MRIVERLFGRVSLPPVEELSDEFQRERARHSIAKANEVQKMDGLREAFESLQAHLHPPEQSDGQK